MLKDQELDALAQGKWQLDCPEIVLSDRKGQACVRGHGRITNAEPGKLRLTVFADRRDSDGKLPERKDSLPELPGHLSMRAIDLSGRTWTAGSILVTWRGCTGESPFWSLAAWCEELRCSRSLTRNPESWPADQRDEVYHWFCFANRLAFPVNAVRREKREEDGQVVSSSESWDVASFEACGHSVTMRRDGERTSLCVSSRAAQVPPFFDERIIEALQFVLAQWCGWTILVTTHGPVEEARVKPLPVFPLHPDVVALMAPVDIRRTNALATWDLFAAYLGHIHGWGRKEWHPVSQFLRSVLVAAFTMPEEMILPLCVAIEGVLNQEYPSVPKAPAGLRDALADVLSCAEAARREGRLDVTQEHLTRLGRILSATLGYPEPGDKARDRLLRLAAAGALDARQVGAWASLRNYITHGRPKLNSLSGTEPFTDGDILLVLYRLIFNAIGYRGKYTDWAAPSAPLVDFVPIDVARADDECQEHPSA